MIPVGRTHTTRPSTSVDRSRSRHAAIRPSLAVFSPWPPKKSGIAAYASRLVTSLQDRYRIDLFHESGYIPELSLNSTTYGARDARLFSRYDRAENYRGVLYQMGNSFHHGCVYDALMACPGVVTLHDYCLSGFQFWRAHRDPGDPFANLRRMMAEQYPTRIADLDPRLRGWTEEPGGFAEALARRRLAVNLDVLTAADALIVHSPWCRDRISEDAPHLLERVHVVPLGATAAPVAWNQRTQTRARFHLPAESLIVGLFGILSSTKMTGEVIEAFGRMARTRPEAHLVLVGADWENGSARDQVGALGLTDRVRFLGHQPDDAYHDLIGAIDIGVSLRRPPTHGETSAALLDLLRRGIPTVVNDSGTLADYPENVVSRFSWEREGIDGLASQITRLADQSERRETLGQAALRYVQNEHDWSIVAERYARVIEQVASVRERSRRQEVRR